VQRSNKVRRDKKEKEKWYKKLKCQNLRAEQAIRANRNK
jgi:hypothetical protein